MAVPRRARRTSRRLLAALVASLVGALCASPAHAAEIGTVPDITWGVSRAEVDRTVRLMREAGFRGVRLSRIHI